MTPRADAIAILILAALTLVTCQLTSADRREAAATRAGLQADNFVATHDTTRLLTLALTTAGDSLRVVQRRALQVTQHADALDRALKSERAARDSLTATIAGYQGLVVTDTLRDTVVVTAADRGDTIRLGTFDVRQAPYTVHASVELPAPPSGGALSLAIDLDTLPLELRIGCGPADDAGVRAATATVRAPTWAAIRLVHVEQAPTICASLGTRSSRWSTVAHLVGRLGVSVGYGVGVGSHNVAFSGLGALVGIRLWP